MSTLTEILVIRGDLGRDAVFRPRFCFSTPRMKRWPRGLLNEYQIELLDGDDIVVGHQPMQLRQPIVCEVLGDEGLPELIGCIPLVKNAVQVRMRQRDLVLWSAPVGDKPSINVQVLSSAKTRVVRLKFRHSLPKGDAYLVVAYEWQGHSKVPVYAGAPVRSLSFDLAWMGGGKRCLFTVQYTDGLRSAVVVSKPIEIAFLPPKVAIRQPIPGTRLPYGVPLVLEGDVFDAQRTGLDADKSLTWWVDGVAVGRGACADVLTPPTGRHAIELRYQWGGVTTTAATSVTVLRRKREQPVPANEWPETHRVGATGRLTPCTR